jgi:hypothetical protein
MKRDETKDETSGKSGGQKKKKDPKGVTPPE